MQSGSVSPSRPSEFVLSDDQIREILLHETDVRNRLILELFVFQGLRLNECATLEIARLDFKGSTFQVLGKGGVMRTLPMLPSTADKLRRVIGRRRHGYVFEGRDGPHLTPHSIGDVVRAAGKRINFRQQCPTRAHLNPHMLRHTFAHRAKRLGLDYEEISRLLGHNNVYRTVLMYGRKSFGEIAENFQKKMAL